MDYTDSTNINSLGLAFSLLMALLLIVLPRKYATIPIFAIACFMTFGQRINIAGINFFMLRILILAGFVRSIFRKEISFFKWNKIDKAMIFWVASNVIIYTLLRQNFAALINRLGFAFNSLGLFFLFRFLIRDFDDLGRVFRLLSIFVITFALVYSIEYATGRNFFSIFGGVNEITAIRDGRLRCRGAFRHPILAGTFGAVMMPMAVFLWHDEKARKLLAIGVFLAGTFIVIASGSSGPILTYLAGLLGLIMWPFRRDMKTVRRLSVFFLIILSFLMKSPIWYLMARLAEFIGSGTGWHRSKLIDAAVEHFDEWWLLGTNYTAHWMSRSIRSNPNMADITNTYIRQGVDGGLLTMVLFILVIVLCFSSIGRTLKAIEKKPLATRLTVWSMGAMLFAHCITFLSVTYFDQIIVFWYMLLAMISTISSSSIVIETAEGMKK